MRGHVCVCLYIGSNTRCLVVEQWKSGHVFAGVANVREEFFLGSYNEELRDL
jgi:hypothetical protein